jgi:ferredoxin-NADP reductase
MNFIVSAKIVNKRYIFDDVIELIVEPDKIRKFTPGSFVQLSLDNVSASERWPESRTFSIASYSSDFMRFLIKNQGVYTNKIISETQIGSTVTIKYPFGEMFNPKYLEHKNIMIAGGLGITPFLSMTQYFKSIDYKKMELFYSVKNENQFIDLDFFKTNIDHLHLYTTQDNSSYINRRISINDIKDRNFSIDDHFYICGSKEFINYYKKELMNLGYFNIHIDEWE